jgi:hypothetical protein
MLMLMSLLALAFAMRVAPPLESPPSAPSQSPQLPPVEETVARYVAAIGGAAAFEPIKSRVTRAKISVSGLKGTLETVQERPDRAAQWGEIESVGRFSTGYDGRAGWNLDPMEGLSEMKGLALRHFVLEMRIDRDVRLLELYPSRKALPDRQSGSRTLRVIELTPSQGLPERWYFDTATALLVLREYTEDRGKAGRVAVTVRYDDYRTVDGMRLPFRLEVREARDDPFAVQVTSVTHNQPIDPARYARPAAK